MRSLLKIIGNTALVVGGFFIVLFASSKASSYGTGHTTLHNDIGVGVANAETSSGASDSGVSGGSGDCGSSDSGGGGK